MDELKKKLEEMGRAFEEFKKINDQRIDEIKKNGSASALTEEKLSKANADIDRLNGEKDRLEKEIEGIKTAMNRAGQGGKDDSEKKGDSKEAKAALDKFMRKAGTGSIDIEAKALSNDSNADGGILVRPELLSKIVTKMFESSPMRQLADVVTITSDYAEILQDLDESGANWVGERQTRSNTTTPQWKWAKIPTQELEAMAPATQKSLDDASIDLESWLVNKISDKFARTEATAFVGGSGVNQPRGFNSYPSGTGYGQIEQVNSGSAGVVTADGLISLSYALKPKYMANASFLMQRLTEAAVRKLKDSQNRYLWEPSLQAGRPNMLFGRPIFWANDMAAIASGALSIAFGDFKQGYQVVDRMGVRLLRDPFTSKPNVLFYATKRVGGDVVDFEAIKLQKLT